MADRGIIFSGPMIRALLDGRKSMTRRALSRAWPVLGSSWTHKSAPWEGLLFDHPLTKARNGRDPHIAVPFLHPDDAARGATWDDDGIYRVRPPYAVGDRLWCRENGWERPERTAQMMRAGADTWARFYFDADGITDIERDDMKRWGFKRRPSIHMPRWASRLTLTVTAVKVERLQEISGLDSIAEGVECETCSAMARSACQGLGCFASLQAFRDLWASLHGPGAWEANPWVCVLSFRSVLKNIDQCEAADVSAN